MEIIVWKHSAIVENGIVVGIMVFVSHSIYLDQ